MTDFQSRLDQLPTEVSLRFARYEKGTPKEGEHQFDAEPKLVLFVLSFCEKGFGFGEVTFKQTPEGLFLDTECTDPERVKRYLCMLVDKAVKDTDDEPEKHALFNRVWQRRCSGRCEVCFPEGAPDEEED